MKSVFGNDGRRFYVLEHKVSSKYHKAGEEQEIIVDQIEIGRSSNCAVQLEGVRPDDPMFQIVSRRHAAIERDGDNWVLVHLSNTNSTFLNGRRLSKAGQRWYLQNGDEIQIAENGPRLGFKIPQGDKGKVGSIGLSRRLSLFRKQALRPYKQGITALVCSLVVLACVGGTLIYTEHKKTMELDRALVAAEQERIEQENKIRSVMDSISRVNSDLTLKVQEGDKAKNEMQRRLREMEKKIKDQVTSTPEVSNSVIDQAKPNIFYIETVAFEYTMDGKTGIIQPTGGQDKEMDALFKSAGYSGTGFLTSDNRFITARHVAEGWYFWNNGGEENKIHKMFNVIANNGGKVVCHFIAVSSSGKQFTFTSDDFIVNRSTDISKNTDNGVRVTHALLNDTDWAYIKNVNMSGGLKVNSERSRNLERKEKLTILGFPLGLGANSMTDINPLFSQAETAHKGLQNGVIITTATTYEQGNSGGPVFVLDGSKSALEVIGIVSAGAGRSTGFVVPISAVK